MHKHMEMAFGATVQSIKVAIDKKYSQSKKKNRKKQQRANNRNRRR